jgi:hypothetical protein
MRYTAMAMMAGACLCALAQRCEDVMASGNKTHEFLILALDAMSDQTYSSAVLPQRKWFQ